MSAPNILNLSRTTKGDQTNTTLEPWAVPFLAPTERDHCLVKSLSTPVIGGKFGTYFLRCSGTKRTNKDTANQSSLLIIDGDSRVTEDGEIVSGAPDPVFIHYFLTKQFIPHCIYSSYSNGKEGADFHKYRVVIPTRSPYSREQLPILLDALFSLLQDAGIRLYNVPENRAWAQAWFFPRVPDEERLKLFKSYVFEGFDAEWFLDPVQLIQPYIPPEPLPVEEPEPEPRQDFSRLNFKEASTDLSINPIKFFNDYWGDPFKYLQTQGYRVAFTRKTKGQFRLLRPGSTTKEPAVVFSTKCCDGEIRIYSFGGDVLNDKKSHDAFDCFRLLEHNGDEKAALKAVGQRFIINGITLEKHNQIQYMAAKQQKSEVVIDWAALLGR